MTDWIAHEYYKHDLALCPLSGTDECVGWPKHSHRPPGLYEVCREQCPICEEQRPSVSHVGHHLRKIAAFALPRMTIFEDDIASGRRNLNDADIESDDDSTDSFSEFELEDAEDDCHQNLTPNSKQWLSLNERLAEQQAKQREMPPPQSTNLASKTIPAHLSIYVRIEPVGMGYGYHSMEPMWFLPPNTPNDIMNERDPITLLRWEGGRNIIVPVNDPIQRADLDEYMYREATIFTKYPHKPHLWAVPFDARTRSVQLFKRGWQRITFNNIRNGDSSSNTYYSYISSRGAGPELTTPEMPHWIPQVWPYPNTSHATSIQSGLIGELPLLFAIAAFSAPPSSPEVLVTSMHPGKWTSHGLSIKRKSESFVTKITLMVRRALWSAGYGCHNLPRSTESSLVYFATA